MSVTNIEEVKDHCLNRIVTVGDSEDALRWASVYSAIRQTEMWYPEQAQTKNDPDLENA